MSKEYRKNVAAIIVNSQGLVLVCERSDVDGAWQLPQGGMDDGESTRETLLRELAEEIGTADVEILDELPFPIRYDWPEHLHNRGHCGQEQYYFLVSLNDESAINLEAHVEHIEFQSYEWISPEEFASRISGFKAEAYKKAMNEFSNRNDGINYELDTPAEEE